MELQTLIGIIVLLVVLGTVGTAAVALYREYNRTQLPPPRRPSPPPQVRQPLPSKARPRPFRVKEVRKRKAVAPAARVAPNEWGRAIRRPPNVPVYHNQQKCVVCHSPIDQSFANKGWARCRRTRKLIHGYCYEELGKCASCHNCNMSREGRVN